MLVKQCYRITSWRYFTEVYETVRSMSREVESVLKEESKAYGLVLAHNH